MSDEGEQRPRALGRLSVARALTDVMKAALNPEVTAASLVTRLRRLADQIEGGSTTKTKAAPAPEVMEVFLHWARATGRVDAKLTSDRRTKIEARLREYDVERLKRAIDGIAASPFHNGTDPKNTTGERHDRIEVVFRNGANVERFSDMPITTTGGRGAPRAVPSPAEYDPREHGDLGHMGGQYRMKHNLLLDVGATRYEAELARRLGA